MNSRLIIGLIFILFGGLYLLDLNNIINFSLGEIISTWWPLLIVFWGINTLRDKGDNLMWGLIISSVGLLLQASKLDILPFPFWSALWPLVLIIVGVSLIFSKKKPKEFNFDFDFKGKKVDKDSLNVASIFSGNKERIISNDFKGGKITTIFGGTEIDLREVVLNQNIVIDIEVVFGGVSIMVPRDIRIVTTGNPVFGGVENNTHPRINDPENEKIIRINYTAVFGGIEIKD